MSEIDVSMCRFYLKDGSCSSMNEECTKCVHNYCDWKVNQEQLQQLKAENEEFKNKLDIMTNYFEKADGESFKYKQCLDEIEEYIYTDCEYNDGCDRNICIRCRYSNIHDKRILQLIKQAKEGGE